MLVALFLISVMAHPVQQLMILALAFHYLEPKVYFKVCLCIIIGIFISLGSLIVSSPKAKVVAIHESYTIVQTRFTKIQVWSHYEGQLDDQVELTGNLEVAPKDTYQAVNRISYQLSKPSITTVKQSHSFRAKLDSKYKNTILVNAFLFNRPIEGLTMLSSLSLQVAGLIAILRRWARPYVSKANVLKMEVGLIIVYSLLFGMTFSLMRLILKRCLGDENAAICLLVLFPGCALSFHFLFPTIKLLLEGLSYQFKSVSFKFLLPVLSILSQNRFNLIEFLLYPVFKWVGGFGVLILLLIPRSENLIESVLRGLRFLMASNLINRFEIVGTISIFSLAILFGLIVFKKHRQATVVVVLLIFGMVYPLRAHVVFIDVGQGDATLIQTVFNAHTILIDTGSQKSYKQLRKQLRSYGVSHIDQLIITHEDEDHNGNVENLKNDFSIGKIVTSYSDIKLLSTFPLDKDYGDTNANSLLLGLKLSGTTFLFTGDAGVDQERDLIRRFPHLRADILKLGHHGSKTSTSKDFLKVIQARIAIASSNPRIYGHPHIEVKQNLFQQRVKLLQTDEEGDIRFVFTFLLDYLHTQGRGFAII